MVRDKQAWDYSARFELAPETPLHSPTICPTVKLPRDSSEALIDVINITR